MTANLIKQGKTANHRHRRAWQDISHDERQLYVDAFKDLADAGITQQFTQAHLDFSEHSNDRSLPWHRHFVWLMETAIRSLGTEYECFAMPYWDWTREPTPKEVGEDGLTLFITSVESLLGGDSDGQCLSDAVWGEGHYDPYTGDCLRRDIDYPEETLACTFHTAASMMEMVDFTDEYGTFRAYLEGTPHALPHVCIGGDDNTHMATFSFPDDPISYLHHSFLDMIWALWQDCNDYDGSGVSSFSDEYDDNINFELEFAPLDSLLDVPNPRVRDTFNIVNDYDVSYEKGVFWDNAGVDLADNCNSDIDSEWFWDDVLNTPKIKAQASYDVSAVVDECKAIEGTIESRGVACCELVQTEEFGGICEKPTVTVDLTVHPQTGEPWPRDPDTGDIVITLEEMTDASYALPECCEARRQAMYAWAVEFSVLEDLLNGCYDPYCKLDDIGTPGYACFDGQAEAHVQSVPIAMLTTISQSLTEISISVNDLVFLVLAALAVMAMVKQCCGRAQDKGFAPKA